MKMPNLYLMIRYILLLTKSFKNSEIFEDKTLLIFENNMTFEFSDFKEHKFKKILLVLK